MIIVRADADILNLLGGCDQPEDLPLFSVPGRGARCRGFCDMSRCVIIFFSFGFAIAHRNRVVGMVQVEERGTCLPEDIDQFLWLQRFHLLSIPQEEPHGPPE